jgi:hypothetical protein
VALLLYIPLLYELFESRGELLKNRLFLCALVILSVFVVLTRNNGVYVVALLFLCICLYFIKIKFNAKKPLAIFLLIGLILPASLPNAAMKILSGKEPLFKESIAIPLQQIAMVVVSEEGKITEEQEEFIYSIYPQEAYFDYYSPMNVDALKWATNPYWTEGQAFLQENKAGFIKTWAELLPHNFPLYVKAYLMETFGFWSPSLSYRRNLPADSASMAELGVERRQIWPARLQRGLEDFYESQYSAITEGNLFWIICLLLLHVLVSKAQKRFIAFIPVLGVWCTVMISAPIAFSLRYVYSLAFALPFLGYIAIMAGKQANE